MDRLVRKPLSSFSDEQRKYYDRLIETRKPRGEGWIGGPFDAWLLNPELYRRAAGLGLMFQDRSKVDRRYIELVILVMGYFWEAQYQWYAHKNQALKAGVPQSVIDAIHTGGKPDFDDNGDRIAYQLTRELYLNHKVSDQTYREAVAEFSEQGVAELVNLAGFYTMVSMTLNTFEVSLPDGTDYPFPVE